MQHDDEGHNVYGALVCQPDYRRWCLQRGMGGGAGVVLEAGGGGRSVDHHIQGTIPVPGFTADSWERKA